MCNQIEIFRKNGNREWNHSMDATKREKIGKQGNTKGRKKEENKGVDKQRNGMSYEGRRDEENSRKILGENERGKEGRG